MYCPGGKISNIVIVILFNETLKISLQTQAYFWLFLLPWGKTRERENTVGHTCAFASKDSCEQIVGTV